jgi:formyl-CoA transferase
MVQTARDVYECPQLEARDMFHEFDFVGRHFRFPGDPVKLSDVPPSPGLPPPRLGEHNRQVLHDLLGLTASEVDALSAEGVI